MKNSLPSFAVGVLLAGSVAFGIAQQGSSSSSQSSGGTQTSSGSASGQASGSGSASAGGRAGGSSQGGAMGAGMKSTGGSASGAARGHSKPTHAIFLDFTKSNVGSRSQEMEHISYVVKLSAQGKVMLEGPWRDEDGLMVIVSVGSDQEAKQIAQNDPYVAQGVATAQVKAWNVRQIFTGHPTVNGPMRHGGGAR